MPRTARSLGSRNSRGSIPRWRQTMATDCANVRTGFRRSLLTVTAAMVGWMVGSLPAVGAAAATSEFRAPLAITGSNPVRVAGGRFADVAGDVAAVSIFEDFGDGAAVSAILQRQPNGSWVQVVEQL